MEKFLSKVLDEQFQVTLEAPEAPPRQQPPPPTDQLDERLRAMAGKVPPLGDNGAEAACPGASGAPGSASPPRGGERGPGGRDNGGRKPAKLTAAQNAEYEQRLAQLEQLFDQLTEKERRLEQEREAVAQHQREMDEAELTLKRRERELLEEQRDTAARFQEEQLQLQREREALLAASQERQAELSQVARYNDELIDLGALLRKEQEEATALAALLQSREQQVETVTHQNRQLMKIVRQREAEAAEVSLALEEAKAHCATLEAELRCTAADLQRAAEERDEAQACVTRLQGEQLDLQEAVDSRAWELVDLRHKHEDCCAQLRQAQDRLKEAVKVKAAAAAGAAGAGDAADAPGRPERAVHHDAAMPLRPLRWRDPKVGLAAAALFCLATVVLLGGTTGAEDRETLRQRNTELGRLIFQQRTELERCHTSVAILTERLGKPTPGPPGTNPAAPT